MSRDQDLDLDAILAEFHGQEEQARPMKRPEPPKTMSRREMREAAERQAAEEKPVPSEEKTVLFETLPAERPAAKPNVTAASPASAKEERTAAEPRGKAAAPAREAAEKPAKPRAAARTQTKKERRPGTAFALMILVLLLLAAALTGLVRWSRLAEEAAKPQPPQEIRLSLGEDLEALLDEEAATSR